MTTINSFVSRLKKIGIEVQLFGNYPWIYLDSVNGKKVHERYLGNHGFTAFWYGIKPGDKPHITDIKKVFAKIRETLSQDENIK